MLLACLYVDDLIFTGHNPAMFKDFKRSMVQEFEMPDIGLIAHFLGIEVAQRKDGIFIPKVAIPRNSQEIWNGELQSSVHSCR